VSVSLLGLVAGCTGSATVGSSSSAVAQSSSPTATPTSHPPSVNPLTGLRPSANPVVAVKIEDTFDARPQVGLDQADIVYIEQVEGGLTRLVAVFDTHLPTSVGPVRSTRNDDPEILQQYGPIIYVASGGSRVEYRPMDRSDLRTVINDRGGPGFRRAGNRPIPHNLFADLAVIAHKVKGPPAKSIGLTWSRSVPNGSAAGPTVSTHVGATPVTFRWNGADHRYVRYLDGHPDRLANGQPVSTPNVVVQFVHGHVFRADIDPAGNPAWYQRTVGSGRVVVFRDGKRIAGTWHRPRAADGTQLLDPAGKPIPLAPGGAWFVLVNTGTGLA
jgi:hypothetical protein